MRPTTIQHAALVSITMLIAPQAFDRAQAQCAGQWQLAGPLGSGTDAIFALARFRHHIIAAGRFEMLGIEPVRRLAWFDEHQWHELGGGVGNSASEFPLVLLNQGDQLLVAGWFTRAGTISANGLAWWDGARWTTDPALLPSTRVNTATYLDGQLCLGGWIQLADERFQFARRTPSGWQGYFRTNEFTTNTMQAYQGAVYVTTGGAFPLPFGRWWPDQARFEVVPPIGPAVAAMTVYQDRLIVAGEPNSLTINGTLHNIGAYDGNSWSALANGLRDSSGRLATIYGLSTDGERLIAVGFFSSSGGNVSVTAWWDGIEWHHVPVDGLPSSATRLYRVASDHHGTIVAGELYRSGSVILPGVASWQRCPADLASPSATRCDGGVTIDDLLAYLDLYASGDRRADLDDGSATGTLDAGITIDDLLYFLDRYASGC